MAKKNDYFTFLGQRYQGNWEKAYNLYQLSKEYKTFAEYLKEHGKKIETDLSEFMSSTEKEFLEAQLKANKFNVSKTAAALKIDRVTLNVKIANLKIEVPGHKINYLPKSYKK